MRVCVSVCRPHHAHTSTDGETVRCVEEGAKQGNQKEKEIKEDTVWRAGELKQEQQK